MTGPAKPRGAPGGAADGALRRQVAAVVGYTVRESLRRWTLLAYLVSVTLLLAALAAAVSLDIVGGTLASARLFGRELVLGQTGIRIHDVVTAFQVAVVALLYLVGMVVALVLTSNLVPSLCAPGWVELMLARPLGRSTLLLARYLGALVVVAINLGYLVVGSWAVLQWKTGFGNAGFLVAGALILYAFAVCHAAVVWAGVATRSTPICAMVGLGVWFGGNLAYVLHATEAWRLALPAGWRRTLASHAADVLYWVLPKSYELGETAVAAVRGKAVALLPVAASLPFAAAALLLACGRLRRQDL